MPCYGLSKINSQTTLNPRLKFTPYSVSQITVSSVVHYGSLEESLHKYIYSFLAIFVEIVCRNIPINTMVGL